MAAISTKEHVVSRINEHYYLCTCGQAGSERWAILHEYPVTTQATTASPTKPSIWRCIFCGRKAFHWVCPFCADAPDGGVG